MRTFRSSRQCTLGLLFSAALFPPQGGLSPRGADSGYPYPVGCLDRAGYVRPEDVGVSSPDFKRIYTSLRSNQAAEAGALLPDLKPSDPSEEIVRAKLWVDYHLLSGDVNRYWDSLNAKVKSFETSKATVPLETRVSFAYCSDYLLNKNHDSDARRIEAVIQAIEALKKESSRGAAAVALASFQSSVDVPAKAVDTLRGYLADHPRAYTVRMQLVWTLGMGSSRENSIVGPVRDRLNREALKEAKLIVKQDDTYYPALLTAAGLSIRLNEKAEGRKLLERYMALAPADHKARASAKAALDALNN